MNKLEKLETKKIQLEKELLKIEWEILAIQKAELEAKKNSNGKIQLDKVVIHWSESNTIPDEHTCNSWKEINDYIILGTQEEIKHHGPEGFGYAKTKVTFYWKDGETWETRIDVCPKETSGNHPASDQIKNSCLFYAGLSKPYHLTEEMYQGYINDWSTRSNLSVKEFTQGYIDFLNKYDLGIPMEKIN